MQVQAIQTATPSFGAKLKKNEETNNLLNNMNNLELGMFKSALKNLNKHHENDVLEIRKDTDSNFFGKPSYSIVNTSNNNEAEITPGLFQSAEFSIIKGLKEASKKGSEIYNALFTDNKAKEEAKEQEAREEVLSMLA